MPAHVQDTTHIDSTGGGCVVDGVRKTPHEHALQLSMDNGRSLGHLPDAFERAIEPVNKLPPQTMALGLIP